MPTRPFSAESVARTGQAMQGHWDNVLSAWSSMWTRNWGAQALPFYAWYEMNHAAVTPWRAVADMTRLYFKNPVNPLAHTTFGKAVAANCELFERLTRRYGKPAFNIPTVLVGGERVAVREQVVWSRPFCNVLHFEKAKHPEKRPHPKVLMVAPMSGHYATLLRGTVEAFLPNHDVYITDWIDARLVPASEGRFDLDDYIDYIISMLHALGPNTHIMAVCQPSVPVLAAVSLMEMNNDPYAPLSMTLMGGPIDTRSNPTAVNKLAQEKGLDWFKRNVITAVPFPHPGVMRRVYPGFLQISGFMTMNLDRHMDAHKELYQNLIRGDGDSVTKHREFYDEYLAVMDLTEEFYLQTIERVFVNHDIPLGRFKHRGRLVEPAAIKRVALMTVEGEKDDITGGGQTEATHRLCPNVPDDKRVHYLQPDVGHYGVFNGSRFRAEIMPRIADFILSAQFGARKDKAPAKAAEPPSVKAEAAKAEAAKIEAAKTEAAKTEDKPKAAAPRTPAPAVAAAKTPTVKPASKTVNARAKVATRKSKRID
jgi:poly(3-hydroxybutyrate) depolymerase